MPKGSVPHPFNATVRIGARWRGGCLSALNDQPLPEIRDGTLIELILPAWAVTNDQERAKLTSKKTIDMLPAKSGVLLGLSPPAVPEEDQRKLIRVDEAVGAAGYLLAEVVLIEPLQIAIDGSQRATLEACRCRISLLKTEAKSLNHAFTLLSQRFETRRISHSGNVFGQGFTHLNGRWRSLDDLRLANVAEFLREMSGAVEASLR